MGSTTRPFSADELAELARWIDTLLTGINFFHSVGLATALFFFFLKKKKFFFACGRRSSQGLALIPPAYTRAAIGIIASTLVATGVVLLLHGREIGPAMIDLESGVPADRADDDDAVAGLRQAESGSTWAWLSLPVLMYVVVKRPMMLLA